MTAATGKRGLRWKGRPEGSNWGDFGPDDQIGRLNLVTPERRRAAAREVREGIAFCLPLPLDCPRVQINPRRFPAGTLLLDAGRGRRGRVPGNGWERFEEIAFDAGRPRRRYVAGSLNKHQADKARDADTRLFTSEAEAMAWLASEEQCAWIEVPQRRAGFGTFQQDCSITH